MNKLLILLNQLWSFYPDMRFFQLIYNLETEYLKYIGQEEVSYDVCRLFYLEDDVFIEWLNNKVAGLK